MKKKLKWIILIGVVVLLAIGSPYIKAAFFNTATKDGYIYIAKEDTYEQILKKVSEFTQNSKDFEKIANLRGYKTHLHSGKYKVRQGDSYYSILSKLYNGKQEEVRLKFNQVETLNQLAGKVSKQINVDSAKFLQHITSPEFLQKNNVNAETVKILFLPNTYNFYWDTSEEEFAAKMKKEYDKFWTAERVEKAKKEGLTPLQTSVLASIVEKETAKRDERGKVARLYLNRLHQDMKLQSDPTVIYAMKQHLGFDTIIKRVYEKNLFEPSPYNTYVNKGLPPAPINFPEPATLDAVINAPQHNYIFMCASVVNWGYHEYAADLATHEINRKKYTDYLNEHQKKK